jgi:hypothetical protein
MTNYNQLINTPFKYLIAYDKFIQELSIFEKNKEEFTKLNEVIKSFKFITIYTNQMKELNH